MNPPSTNHWSFTVLILCLAFGMNAMADIPGLVGYWPLDEGRGNVAEELSGKGNLGWICGEDIKWVETERGMALRFDGKTNVRVPDSPAWNIGPGELTFSMWVKWGKGNAGDIFEHTFENKPGVWVLHAGNPPVMSFYDDKSVGQDIRFHGFQPGKWQHLALVWRRDKNGWMKSYVNGVLGQSRSAEVTIKQFGDLYFGSMRAYNYFKGYLKEVAIFNRALSDDEVGALYRDGVRIEHPAVIYSKTRGNVLAVYRGGVLLRGSSVVSPATGKVLYDRKQDEDSSVGIPYDVPPGQRQLFLDDYNVAKIENLERTMHQPDKKGAVIRPDPAVGEDFIQARMAPVWDPKNKIFKFWNLYAPAGLPATGYYESRDGLHWSKPVVGQLAYRGSMEHNYISVKRDGKHHRITMVVYDGADLDPTRRFKSFLPNVGFAVSPDGIKWALLDVPAVPSSDNFSFSFDEKAHLFIGTVKIGGPHGRSVGLATSTDFINWTNHGLVFHADDLDQELGLKNINARFADPTLHHPCYNIPHTYNVDVYLMAIFRYESLYIGMPAMYHQTGKVPGNWPGFRDMPLTDNMRKIYTRDGDWAGFHDVQLTCSRDLKNWQRLGDRKPFIGSSPVGGGAYDTANIKPPPAPLVRGDELWFYYTGGKFYGAILDRPSHRLAGAICLAVLRRDGFVSLDAGENEGVLVTKPFVLTKGPLHVNVNARGGELRAEVFGDGGTHLISEPVTGDQPRAEVRWRDGDLATLQGRPVTLRFTLRQAQLYSYWLKK